MKILDAKFVQDFIKMANDGFLQGWHERSSGTCRIILPCNRKWKVFQKYYR